jgi:hypothetical protein
MVIGEALLAARRRRVPGVALAARKGEGSWWMANCAAGDAPDKLAATALLTLLRPSW